MSSQQRQLEEAMAAVESQRTVLGDLAVDAMLAGLRARMAFLTAPAAPPAEPVPILKQVSILFMDVVGSTGMAQRLDAEDTLSAMTDVLRRLAAIVEAHEGRVLRFTGDGIKAAFGMDEVREDDPERAVRAGLAILGAVQAVGRDLERVHGVRELAVRVGVHTGVVALGTGIEDKNTATGAAVTVAARMEQSAPPGGLRISHDTYAHVRGLFEVEAQEPLALKGIDKPVLSYRVLRAKPRNFRIGTRGIEGVRTRMIGREAELELLRDSTLRLAKSRREQPLERISTELKRNAGDEVVCRAFSSLWR